MWQQRQRFPGVKENSDGTIDFSLTDEEAREADLALQAFKGVLVHPDAADQVRNGTIAVALCRYAKDLVTQHYAEAVDIQDPSKWSAVQAAVEKAVAAVWKSYSLFPLPIFLYHRASFLQMLKMEDDARRLYAAFLKQQAELKVDDLTKALMNYEGTNVEKALSKARQEG